ncbi:39S ribosomal protein L22 [Cricetulus griseus]|nr:39S ribosomal protein L22 [Cricetulus griseus]
MKGCQKLEPLSVSGFILCMLHVYRVTSHFLQRFGSFDVQEHSLGISVLMASRVLPQSCIHTSASLDISQRWEKKNNIVYPPQLPGEPRRPAEIYHCRRQIKYSKDKMWYLAKLIRGMSIDQALAQLEFNDKKGAQIIKEVLLEAQDMAVREHNVEFRSNLYVAESTSGRGQCLKRLRYHGRGRFGIMEKVYCHYFVKLVEGPPPPPEARKTTFDHAKEYIQQLRSRTIIHTL